MLFLMRVIDKKIVSNRVIVGETMYFKTHINIKKIPKISQKNLLKKLANLEKKIYTG